jgi:hypothetical protein
VEWSDSTGSECLFACWYPFLFSIGGAHCSWAIFCKLESDKPASARIAGQQKLKTGRKSKMSDSLHDEQKVIVTDLRMPFGSMVVFLIKWTLAAIPAIIILWFIMAVLTMIFMAMFGGMFHGMVGQPQPFWNATGISHRGCKSWNLGDEPILKILLKPLGLDGCSSGKGALSGPATSHWPVGLSKNASAEETMNIEQSVVVQCPYCAESFEVLVDTSLGEQELIEDCEVCCRPVTLMVSVTDDGVAHVETRGEDVWCSWSRGRAGTRDRKKKAETEAVSRILWITIEVVKLQPFIFAAYPNTLLAELSGQLFSPGERAFLFGLASGRFS